MHINEILRVFVCIFSYFSIFNSFHLLKCLMIVVLQKTPRNPESQSIFHELYIHIYVYIHILIHIFYICYLNSKKQHIVLLVQYHKTTFNE